MMLLASMELLFFYFRTASEAAASPLWPWSQRRQPVLNTCHSASRDSKGCSAYCFKRSRSHIRSPEIAVPVRCRQIIKQRRNCQGNGQIHRCLGKEMDKCQVSKRFLYYLSFIEVRYLFKCYCRERNKHSDDNNVLQPARQGYLLHECSGISPSKAWWIFAFQNCKAVY